ncbi:uncharacterized protein [Ptychodera flava]|uniref:uncharacterized protein n=1 Tax=Ptychodera flava TaxID=63121 RepID=UPI00396A176B
MEQIQSTIHHPSNSNGEVIISIEDDVLEENRECDGEEIAQNAFKWFQTNFTCRSLPDKMKATDFIKRIKELSEDFSDQLFMLINGKRGASIHLHELIGAVYRLTSERCQRKEASDLFDSFRKLCPACQETRRVSKEDFKRVIQSKKGMKSLYSVLKDPNDGILTCEELERKFQVLSR